MNTIWTKELDETLREEWAGQRSAREIGIVMGMTKSAIIGRAHRLGLPKRPPPAHIVGIWTLEKEEMLRNLYAQNLTGIEIAERMGMTVQAVQRRASYLGITNKIRTRAPQTARPSAGRGFLSQATRPATNSEAPRPAPAVPARLFPNRHCCWIKDEGRSCDAPVQANARGLPSSYCPEHFVVCFTPPVKGAPPPLHWRA
jgi:hypothetical protein